MGTVGDITTILGFFLSFDQKPCNSCGEKFSTFLVLRSTGHKKATAQVLLYVHANSEVGSRCTVPIGLLCLLTFT